MNKDQNNKFLFDPERVNEALKSAKNMDDLFAEGGALQLMLKNSMETILFLVTYSLTTYAFNPYQSYNWYTPYELAPGGGTPCESAPWDSACSGTQAHCEYDPNSRSCSFGSVELNSVKG